MGQKSLCSGVGPGVKNPSTKEVWGHQYIARYLSMRLPRTKDLDLNLVNSDGSMNQS